MSANSKIAWTDHTFNPWIGCTRVSEGCRHCYAESYAKRYGKAEWGPLAKRVKTSPAYWMQPGLWNRQEFVECTLCGWRGNPKSKDKCQCIAPFKDARQRVFCASLADVFEVNPQVEEWRAELFSLIEQTPNLDWLLLTKRPEKIYSEGTRAVGNAMRDFDIWLAGRTNVWLGVTMENQHEADKRSKDFIRVGPCLRFLSLEPLLEEIVIPDIKKYDWVIVGGESGPGCRPFAWDWARSALEQCRAYGIPFFMKQGGGHPYKRDKLEDFPEDLRVREFPNG